MSRGRGNGCTGGPHLLTKRAPFISHRFHDECRFLDRQQWAQPHAKWDDEFLPAQHPAERFRYQHEPLYRSDAAKLRGPTERPSARRASPAVTFTQPPVIIVQSDEMADEYDSSELFDDADLDEDRSVAKSDVDDSVLLDDDADPMDDDPLVITARPRPTPGPRPETGDGPASGEWPVSQENQASGEQQPAGAVWQRYPQLLGPPTPPGKRVITAEGHAPAAPGPKPDLNHRVSYGLTAASHYARLQPSLKLKNGTGLRQRIVPRPYRRRPISSTTTTVKPRVEMAPDSETDPDAEADVAEDVAIDDGADYSPEVDFESHEENFDFVPDEDEDGVDEIQSPDVEQAETEDEETLSTGSTTTTTTTAQSTTTSVTTTTTAKPSTQTSDSKPAGPVDIKELLRNAGPLSLSEVLQQRGMSLAELLKGNGGNRIAPVLGVSGEPAKSEPATTTTLATTTAHATTARPDALPQVKPISLKELLAAKNMSITDILKPSEAAKTEKPAETPSPTLKPGVKRPVPFSPGRAKGLAGLVAPTAPPETAEPERPPEKTEKTEPVHKPVDARPTSQLKPLIFGGGGTLDEAASSTTTQAAKLVPVQTKRPYVPGTHVGEYGVHTGRSFEEDGDEEDASPKSIFSGMVGGYGNQRPIATSRLTPPPARKSRPVLHFNYNALSEEEEEEVSDTTVTPIYTHFNEDELKEDHPYFDLPLSVRSAIIASSAVGGLCLVVFIVILTVFMVKQKTRIRLRHPTALFGMSTTALTPSNGSESSGITTPVSQPTSKGGYAKLPQRSSSLWGTLRRSVRQINSVHYS